MNNDSLSIRDAAEEAVSTLSSTESKEAPVEEVKSEPTVETEQSTEAPTTETETKEETFTNIDPKTLAPELQETYRNLQRGYTQARQKETAELKELRAKIAELEERSNYEPTQDQNQKDLSQLTPEEFVEHIRQEAARQANEAVLNDRKELFRKEAVNVYNSIDPRLNIDDPVEYDELMDNYVGSRLDKALEEHLTEGGDEFSFDYKAKAQELIKSWDDYLDRQNKRFIAKQNEIAKNNASKTAPRNPNRSVGSTRPSGTMSIREAIEAALAKQN